ACGYRWRVRRMSQSSQKRPSGGPLETMRRSWARAASGAGGDQVYPHLHVERHGIASLELRRADVEMAAVQLDDAVGRGGLAGDLQGERQGHRPADALEGEGPRHL